MSDLDGIARCRLVVHDFLARLILHDPFIKLWSYEHHTLRKILKFGMRGCKMVHSEISLLMVIVCKTTHRSFRIHLVQFVRRVSFHQCLPSFEIWHSRFSTTFECKSLKTFERTNFDNWLPFSESVSHSDYLVFFYHILPISSQFYEKCTKIARSYAAFLFKHIGKVCIMVNMWYAKN